MRNPKVILDIFTKKTVKKDFKFERIYRLLYNRDFYVVSYKKFKTKKHTNNKTLNTSNTSNVYELNCNVIEEVIKELRDESYTPVNIHSNNSSNFYNKKLVLYTDALIQETITMILESIYEPLFIDSSHGFRTQKNYYTAFSDIRNNFKDTVWWIKIDISNFYSNIDYSILNNILRKKIQDEKFIRLINKFLKAGYMKDWDIQYAYSSIPKQGRLGSILTNIYLNELDKTVINLKKNLKNINYIRYANNILIGINGTKKNALHIQALISNFLYSKLHIYLTEGSNLLIHNSKLVRFLGYDIGILVQKDKQTLTNSRKIGLYLPYDCMRKFLIENKFIKITSNNKWIAIHKPNLINHNNFEILTYYNFAINKFYKHYKYADNIQKFNKARHLIRLSWGRTMANKYKSSVKEIFSKYKSKGDIGIFINYENEFEFIPFHNIPIKQFKIMDKTTGEPYTLKNVRAVRRKVEQDLLHK